MLTRINRFLPYICFLVSSLYSYFVIKLTGTNDSYPTIGFILFLLYAFYYEVTSLSDTIENERPILMRFLGYNASLYLGIVCGFLLAGSPEGSLWMVDSYTMHIPGSVNIANVLHGVSSLRETSSVFDKIYIIHYWTGMWFWLFGVFPAVSAMAMLPLKSLTAFLIFVLGKKIYGSKGGLTASLIYLFMPTVLFYTTAFYKESIIHLIVAALYLSIHAVFIEKKYKYILLLIPSLYFLSNERFYLFPFFLGTILLLLLSIKEIPLKFKIGVCSIGLLLIALFIKKYQGQIPFENIMVGLKTFRNNYNNYSDISSIYNSDLLYPLAFIKLLFTPFFTLNKFKMFFDFSYLLIWGSLLNQFLIFMGLIGVIKTIRKHWFLLLPLLCFITLFAYIAPYNGRLRDSFYPLLAIFAVGGFHIFYKFLIKFNPKKVLSIIVIFFSLIPSISQARYFWSAEVSLFDISTFQPIDSVNNEDLLYATMTNGMNKAIFLAISENLKWDKYYHLDSLETLYPPKLATHNKLTYLLYLNDKTNKLHILTMKGTKLGENLSTTLSSQAPFEVTSSKKDVLLAIDFQLYTFDGHNLTKHSNLPLKKGDRIASLCSTKSKTIIFFQKNNDSDIWFIELYDQAWSKKNKVRSLSSDMLPTLKCTDNKIFAVTLKRTEENSSYYRASFITLDEQYLIHEKTPLNIMTSDRISFSMVKNKKGDLFPRFLYKNIDTKAIHFDGQVQSHPGLLEFLFK